MGAKTSSKREVLFVTAAIIFLYGLAGSFFALAKRNHSGAAYEIFRHKAQYAEKIGGQRRILLSGGSNLIWGYRSTLLEEELGIPVANIALGGEGGDPKLMRELTLHLVRPGDIVVYATTSFWGTNHLDPNESTALRSAIGLPSLNAGRLDHFQSLIRKFWQPWPSGSSLAASAPLLYRRYIKHELSEHLARLNEQGDMKSCLGGKPLPTVFRHPLSAQGFIADIRRFEEQLLKKGAQLVFDVPWMLVQEADQQEWISAYSPMLATLREQHISLVDSVNETLFVERDMFCDTAHHLSDAAARERSLRLSAFLKNLLDPAEAEIELGDVLSSFFTY